jgi:hypothetical protein
MGSADLSNLVAHLGLARVACEASLIQLCLLEPQHPCR